MNNTIDPTIFRAYDIRGVYPSSINEEIVYKIAQAYVALIHPQTVVIGHDVRISGESLAQAATNGFRDAGVNVIDIGEISTDMLYFAVAKYGYDGGFAISASHNPREFNGVKMVREHAIPIAGDSGIPTMRDWVLAGNVTHIDKKGAYERKNVLDDYLTKILSFLHTPLTKQHTIVANANFGMAGIALQALIQKGNLPVTVTQLNCLPDGSFPKGRPDPMIPSSHIETSAQIKEVNADFGVAWDGDADRCFFFGGDGTFYNGYYTTAVLMRYFLERYPRASVFSDARLIFAQRDIAKELSGNLILGKAGHSFIKEIMRRDNIIFGGEATGHYYYKDFYFADNGMIAFILMLQLLEQCSSINDLYADLLAKYHISGEINFTVPNKEALLTSIDTRYMGSGKRETIDGISYEYASWRFNVRSSNTENLIRLNIEGYDEAIVTEKTKEITAFIQQYGGVIEEL